MSRTGRRSMTMRRRALTPKGCAANCGTMSMSIAATANRGHRGTIFAPQGQAVTERGKRRMRASNWAKFDLGGTHS